MLRAAEFRARAADLSFGFDQLLRLEPSSAGFALIAACPLPVAMRALPFNVPVWKKTAAARTIILIYRLLSDVSLFIEL